MIAIDVPTEQLRAFCRKWKVTEFALFGSVTRADFTAESDVDVMVAFAPDTRWSLFDLVDMKDELESAFERKVDVITRYGIETSRNQLRRNAILRSAVQLDIA
jgi:predicted nucleotidyltransferase